MIRSLPHSAFPKTSASLPVSPVALIYKSEGFSQHTAPLVAMVHIVDGAAKITVSENPYNLKARDVILMPRNEPYALHASERFKMLLVMIKG